MTNNITAFFEERLRDVDQDVERDTFERDGGSQVGDHDHLREPFIFHTSELGHPSHSDDYSSDGGYDGEAEYGRHSRQRTFSSHIFLQLFLTLSPHLPCRFLRSDEPCLPQAAVERPMGPSSQLFNVL